MVSVCASVSGGELTPAEPATLNTNTYNRISVRLVTPLCAAVTLLEVTTPGLGTAGTACQIVLLGKWWCAPSRPGSSQQMPSDLTVICRPLPPVGEYSLLELTCHFGTSGTSRRSKGHSPPTLIQPFFMDSPPRLASPAVGWQRAPAPRHGCLSHKWQLRTRCSSCPAASWPCCCSQVILSKAVLPERSLTQGLMTVSLCWND